MPTSVNDGRYLICKLKQTLSFPGLLCGSGVYDRSRKKPEADDFLLGGWIALSKRSSKMVLLVGLFRQQRQSGAYLQEGRSESSVGGSALLGTGG